MMEYLKKISNARLILLINERFKTSFDLNILDKPGNQMQKGELSLLIRIMINEGSLK